jgi:hypothetical protein
LIAVVTTITPHLGSRRIEARVAHWSSPIRYAEDSLVTNLSHLGARIRGEFTEMPGLRLTVTQAQRRFGLDDATCEQVIDALVNAAFLHRRGNLICRSDIP